MGSYNANQHLIIFIFSMIFCSLFSSMSVQCLNIQDLDDIIHTYATLTNTRQRTGSLHTIDLPANLSGIEASVVMMRSSMFWKEGANFSHFHFPRKAKTTPFVKRISLVYENLGNWSSKYFQVPGHSFISPVIGFRAYDASNPNVLGDERLNFSMSGSDSVSIYFRSLIMRDHENVMIKCVTFGADTSNGSFQFSNVTRNYEFATRSSYGYFALVVVDHKTGKKNSKWWWVVLTAVGFSGLILFGLIVLRLVKSKKIKEMERESEKSQTIGSVWIGNSRMPSADMIRTQPSLEHHDHVPAGSSPL